MAVQIPVLDIGKSVANVPFEIHTMQWLADNRWQQNSTPHRHSYFVIIWVRKGSGQHLIDVNRYEIGDNLVYCLTPGQVHLVQANANTDGFVISFTREFLYMSGQEQDPTLTALFNAFTQSPVIAVDEGMEPEMLEIAEKMMKEYKNFFLLRAEILRGFLKIFLIYLTRQYEQPADHTAQSKNAELVKRFHALLDKLYTQKKQVADYAAELAVTPNYLNEMVKKVSGFSVSHHIQQRIVMEAKRRAMYLDVSMKEIAYDLGFDDVAHFSKFFKNVAGVSFSDYKKGIAGRYSA
jgi:AraC-like DNA-binding protein